MVVFDKMSSRLYTIESRPSTKFIFDYRYRSMEGFLSWIVVFHPFRFCEIVIDIPTKDFKVCENLVEIEIDTPILRLQYSLMSLNILREVRL